MKYYKNLTSGDITAVDTGDIVPENSYEVLEKDYQAQQYQLEDQISFDQRSWEVKRRLAYPPITDYLDAVVKGDQAQIDAYIAACQAVKARYPKT